MAEMISGTITIGWSVDERALLPSGDEDLTPAQVRALCDRLEELLGGALPTQSWVDVFIDGEDQPPVRVHFEALGDDEIEIDDGPDNGTLADLRRYAAEDDNDA